MNAAPQFKKVKMSIAKGFAHQSPLKLVALLVLGGVMLTITGLHFAPGRANETPARSLSEDIQIIPKDEGVHLSPSVDGLRADEAASPGYRAWAKRFQEEKAAINLLRQEAGTSDEAAFLLDEVNEGAMTGVQGWEQYGQSAKAAVQAVPEDSRRFDAPYYDDFRTQKEAGPLSGHAWQCFYPEDDGLRVGGSRPGSKLC